MVMPAIQLIINRQRPIQSAPRYHHRQSDRPVEPQNPHAADCTAEQTPPARQGRAVISAARGILIELLHIRDNTERQRIS